MFVVPGLAWSILFGQNHLHKTQAHTNHAALQVYFADPQLNFIVKCRDANPFDAFPSLRNQPSSSASQGSQVPMLFVYSLPCQPPPTIVPTSSFIVVSI